METTFDPSGPLIAVIAHAAGPLSEVPLRLVLDTAAGMTFLTPEVIDLLGYSPRDGEVITTVSSPLGRERGYTLRVAKFEALGFAVSDFPVNVFDLAERDDFDGLIGLNFLRRFNLEIRFVEGRILAEDTSP